MPQSRDDDAKASAWPAGRRDCGVTRFGAAITPSKSFHVGLHFADTLIALRRLALQGAKDDLIQPAIHSRFHDRRREPAERQLAREHLVKHDA